MASKALVLTIAGIGCLAAAGGAAYWAPRHEAMPVAAPSPAIAPVADRAEPPVVSHPAAIAPASDAVNTASAPSEASSAAAPALESVDAPAKSVEEPPRAPTLESTAPPVATIAPSVAVPPPTATTMAATPGIETPPPPPTDPEPAVQPSPHESITIKEDSVIGIRLDQTISTETARVEDRVTARVTRDVRVDGRTAIPEGATLEGSVTLVERGGRFHDNARLGVKFTTLVLDEHTRVPLVTDTIYRIGESASNEASSKIGASAVVGAILGAVVGGKRGAAIGGSAGAAGGAAAVAAGRPNDAVLQAGMPLTVRLSQAVTVEIERR